MSDTHSEIGPELRQLAQAILDRVEPVLQAAAAATAGRGELPTVCQQVWCPVCALAAMVSGEHHPLLDVIAEHSTALLTTVRAMLDDRADRPEPPPSGGDADTADGSNGNGRARPSPGHYQRIPIRVEE